MKKLIVIIALFAGLCSFAQTPVAMTNPNGLALDTAINTTAEGPVYGPIEYSRKSVACQITLTKLSGTVAGTTGLYGSLDGTNYGLIGTARTNTDVTSQTWVFEDLPKAFRYYKVLITGSGTMSVSYSAKIGTTR